MDHFSLLGYLALAAAAPAIGILVWYVWRQPPLTRGTKTALAFGLGVLPIASASTANIEGYEATTKRSFCGSCHVMTPITDDSVDARSAGLAARHARNAFFGERNCYVCHADYGMFGTVLTKWGGMRHVWYYYTEFHDMPLEEAKTKIHLVKPYPNENCMHCHSTKLQGWLKEPEHRASADDARAGRISCASPGCHGYAHPNMAPQGADTKLPAQLAPASSATASHGAGMIDAGVPDAR